MTTRAFGIGLALGVCLALVLPQVIQTAHAGESNTAGVPGLIGTIRADDGGFAVNCDTGYLNGYANGNSVPFTLSTQNQRLTIQCDQAAYVLTDVYGVDAGTGLKLAADEKLTTSVNSVGRTATMRDGGTYTGGLISICPIGGASTPTVVCRVWSRTGLE